VSDEAATSTNAIATTEPPALLEARSLRCGYGSVAVVRDLDLTVRSGEVVLVMGANGAGKTTTLLTLAGILRPLAGEVRFDGREAHGSVHRRVRAGLALVPEERSVFSKLSVRDNLRLARGSRRLVSETFPELERLASRRAGLLSGGEQQMLTVARALSKRPKLLLADELSFGLAPLIVRRLLQVLRSAADDGAGVLLVEQHARQALAIADRAYVMRHGQIVLEGSAEEVAGRFDSVRESYL
jgi:ABC-type branched-subunit amino acid transport system ATPase component